MLWMDEAKVGENRAREVSRSKVRYVPSLENHCVDIR